jgi:streptolysin S family bacteriocin protoxin
MAMSEAKSSTRAHHREWRWSHRISMSWKLGAGRSGRRSEHLGEASDARERRRVGAGGSRAGCPERCCAVSLRAGAGAASRDGGGGAGAGEALGGT